MSEYQQHPIAQRIPKPNAEDRKSLRDSIAKGFDDRFPIWLFEDMILDGWTRYAICVELGVKPIFKKFQGDNPTAFVIRANLDRRHLGPASRIAVAKMYEPELRTEAAARSGAGLKNGHTPQESRAGANLSQREPGRVAAKLADLAGVSEGTVKNYNRAEANGTPELVEMMKSNEVSIADAACAVAEPAEVQAGAVAAKRSGRVKTLKEAIEKEKAGAESLDSAGKPIPSDLADVFALAPEFQACITQLNAVSRKLDELAETDAGKKLTSKGIRNDLNNAKNAIRFAKPYAVCPYCRSSKKQCCACKGLKWLDEQQYQRVPEDMQ